MNCDTTFVFLNYFWFVFHHNNFLSKTPFTKFSWENEDKNELEFRETIHLFWLAKFATSSGFFTSKSSPLLQSFFSLLLKNKPRIHLVDCCI